MKKDSSKTKRYPVAFFVFRRPDTTARVLEEIIKSNPPKLYIFADGARNIDDEAMVGKTRAVVDKLLENKQIVVVKKYRESNVGLKRSMIEGLDEVFLREDAVIVLEDDCLPSPQFFNFCNICLNKYENDTKINTICGTNILLDSKNPKECIASKYFIPWGWALWKRSWEDYKGVSVKEIYSVVEKSGLNKLVKRYFLEVFKLSEMGVIKSWSYKMVIMQLVKEKFSLVPPSNLISNIGFGENSSNTFFRISVSNLRIDKETSRQINNISSYRSDKGYDNKVVYRHYLTPVSVGGLIMRKYFPWLMKFLYS